MKTFFDKVKGNALDLFAISLTLMAVSYGVGAILNEFNYQTSTWMLCTFLPTSVVALVIFFSCTDQIFNLFSQAIADGIEKIFGPHQVE